MSTTSPEPAFRRNNPLFLPLVMVSGFAVLQAVALVILLALLTRQAPPPPGVNAAPPRIASAAGAEPGSASKEPPGGAAVVSAAAVTPAVAPPAEVQLPHGRLGQRVESAGFAITVEKIIHEPAYDPLGEVNEQRRYLALLLLVENNTGGNVSFYPVMFRLQDSESYEYKPLAMKLIAPSLDYRNLGNRETVRGYVDFIVPRSSKDLTLIYTHLAQPIHIKLEE